ncbi:type IX secretion system membrane protein PorP/SprF [Flavobacterium sufflavum]|uniref:Type IX secretion system membrane protein PorP/SprF n=1 Tax=Flavobacterium sufflavum TaxID=1921138 RepID=A0A3S2TY47_9FLAO|nr:type IX secretion system membrane protein PorP/SprF [Flavobacterium sufflavum]RVT71106.1 type IX secretion system membrane protein PorP/SprF [Flavobacterium sufflavum]
MKKIFIIYILFLIGTSIYAQQEPQYTQYMYNPTVINPAYAGSKGYTSIYGLYRTQWVGLDGAPKTANISMNKPIEGSKLGYGVSVLSDKIGVSDETQIAVDLTYNLFLQNDSRLAFGLKASGSFLNVDYTRLNQYNMGEQVLQNNITNQFSPNIGIGLYYYNKKSYLGASVPMLLDTEKYDHDNKAQVNQRYHIYLMGGRVYDLSYNLKFKPAFVSKIVSGAPLQFDLSTNFMFNEKFIIGAAYRWSASVSMLAGFQLRENLFIGYGYDTETTRLSNFNSGSHEIFLQFDLFKNHSKLETPRFF